MGDLFVDSPRRSLLFVPAHEGELLEDAYRTTADGVVADLEEGVPAARKAEGRRVLEELIGAAPPGKRLVRVNEVDSEYLADDLAAASQLSIDGLVVPKANARAIAEIGFVGVPIIAVIETAIGVREAFEVASSTGVSRLVLGGFDLTADMNLRSRPDALELLYARSKLVVDSRAAGIEPPIDRVFPRSTDLSGLTADALFARSLGFGGKACKDRMHLDVVNRVFGELS
jgi:citrate lyase beta subunit